MQHFLQDLCRGAQGGVLRWHSRKKSLAALRSGWGRPTAYMKTLVSTKLTSRLPRDSGSR